MYSLRDDQHDGRIIGIVGKEGFAENTEIFIENNNAEVLTPELYEFHRTDAFIQSRGRISNPVINLPVDRTASYYTRHSHRSLRGLLSTRLAIVLCRSTYF